MYYYCIKNNRILVYSIGAAQSVAYIKLLLSNTTNFAGPHHIVYTSVF
jgi:hypothetical protein